MEILIFVFFIVVLVIIVLIQSWASKIDDSRIQHQSIKNQFIQSVQLNNSYIPIMDNNISRDSDKLIILKYKLQNAEQLNTVLLLGLWYFGLAHMYWQMDRNSIDPHKLAEVINQKMPWFVDTVTQNIDDPITFDVFKEHTELKPFINETCHIIQPSSESIDYSYLMIPTSDDYINSTNDGNIDIAHIDNDSYSGQIEDNVIDIPSITDEYEIDFIDVHVEHDMNFFPYLMTEPQFNQADQIYQNPINI